MNLRRIFDETRPDVVIHLAAWAGVRPSLEKPELYSAVNVTGTVHLLEMAQTKCFVFGSSSSVYGGNPKVPFEEDPVNRPVSPYAATKRAGELLCHTYAHNFGCILPVSIFYRVCKTTPRNGNPQILPANDARKRSSYFRLGRVQRDYTYVEDIVSGILAAIEVNPGFEIINLGDPTISLIEMVRHLEDALGKKALLHFSPRINPETWKPRLRI